MDSDMKDVIVMSAGRCHGTVREAGEKILGFRRKKKDEWIPEGKWDKLNLTRSVRFKNF